MPLKERKRGAKAVNPAWLFLLSTGGDFLVSCFASV